MNAELGVGAGLRAHGLGVRAKAFRAAQIGGRRCLGRKIGDGGWSSRSIGHDGLCGQGRGRRLGQLLLLFDGRDELFEAVRRNVLLRASTSTHRLEAADAWVLDVERMDRCLALDAVCFVVGERLDARLDAGRELGQAVGDGSRFGLGLDGHGRCQCWWRAGSQGGGFTTKGLSIP